MERFSAKVYCRKCKNRNHHGIIMSHSEKSEYPYDDFDWKHEYFIVQCLGCDTVAFVSEYGDESMIDLDPHGENRHFTDVIVYPEEPKVEKKSRYEPHKPLDFRESPEAIQIMYSQIVSAFNMESYLLSAVGLRMLVEGICKDLGIQGGYVLDESGNKKLKEDSTDEVFSKRLEGKINGLVEKNVVVQSQANILHKIRGLGNSSAHELKQPTRRTLKLAIDILEKIIEQIYELDNYSFKFK
ncbi:DUF4145 domain-containing protein [Planococcus sp. ISL-109]|uniref:DUF4145 domain-containing protein n=1 Tax=Planococcus sp. ISL-109 TaxID=2819166 RepID=UPI001BEA9BA8|nr:DUF4145 domain-containing protein [Planococcus sp. ISL-109]MBT2581756.1 DUF4145 domain-containing protein [Planococcus sp. ISL-109]